MSLVNFAGWKKKRKKNVLIIYAPFTREAHGCSTPEVTFWSFFVGKFGGVDKFG